jgi:hypothetical protein
MRMAPKTFIALLLSVLILPTGILAPAQAATPTRMTAFSMTPAVSAPTGLGTTTVTVSTHLVDPDGISPTDARFDGTVLGGVLGRCPCVRVLGPGQSADYPAPFVYVVPLTLTSGTTKDGTWTGRFKLGSGQSGHWRTQILAGDFGESDPPGTFTASTFSNLPSPFTAVGVDIHGTNRPLITLLSVVKQTNGRYLVKGKAFRATTGTPIRNTRLEVTGECHTPLAYSLIGVRTNSAGVYAVSLTKTQLGGSGFTICVRQVAYPGQWRLASSGTRGAFN